MIDYTSGGQEKKSGCLGRILIVLLVLGIISIAAFFLLPKLIVKSGPDNFIYKALPEEVKSEVDKFNNLITENIGQLDKYGLDAFEASEILKSLDYGTFTDILEELDSSQISDTSELIDVVQGHIDLSLLDVDRIKKDYYAPVDEEDLRNILSRFKENPLIMRSGFTLVKATVQSALEEQYNRDGSAGVIEEVPAEEKSSSGGSTTKKKKN